MLDGPLSAAPPTSQQRPYGALARLGALQGFASAVGRDTPLLTQLSRSAYVRNRAHPRRNPLPDAHAPKGEYATTRSE
jgi:hypothetical protein